MKTNKTKDKLRLGIVGTGRIAKRFIESGRREDRILVSCVYNPNMESAKRYAMEYQVPEYTDNFEVFMDKIDMAYVASPHETHVLYTRRLLNHGIHVLCEKPLALCECDARELFSLAKEKGCILMEAIKTAYCPGFLALMNLAKTGVIGEIRDVEACFTKLEKSDSRELTDVCYGGSVTELGSYVLLPIIKLLGKDCKKLYFSSQNTDKNIDVYTKIHMEYEEAFALGKVGLGVKSEGQLIIAGTKGYIYAEAPWWLTKNFEVRFEDAARREHYQYPYEGSGLQYELSVFVNAVSSRKKDDTIGLQDEESIVIAGVMEQFLKTRNGIFDDL